MSEAEPLDVVLHILLSPQVTLFAHLLCALLFGAAIGLERQWRQRMAGLRTNALVALGSASFVTLPLLVGGELSPTRVAAQVVSGIGFLGGGVILREGVSVRGLNTAATLWGSASVGVLAGSGFVLEAMMVTLLVLGANVLLRPLAHKINRQPHAAGEVEALYTVDIVCGSPSEAQVRALLLQMVSGGPLQLRRLKSKDIKGADAVRVQAELVITGREDGLLERIVSRMSLEGSVTEVSWGVSSV